MSTRVANFWNPVRESSHNKVERDILIFEENLNKICFLSEKYLMSDTILTNFSAYKCVHSVLDLNWFRGDPVFSGYPINLQN